MTLFTVSYTITATILKSKLNNFLVFGLPKEIEMFLTEVDMFLIFSNRTILPQPRSYPSLISQWDNEGPALLSQQNPLSLLPCKSTLVTSKTLATSYSYALGMLPGLLSPVQFFGASSPRLKTSLFLHYGSSMDTPKLIASTCSNPINQVTHVVSPAVVQHAISNLVKSFRESCPGAASLLHFWFQSTKQEQVSGISSGLSCQTLPPWLRHILGFPIYY